MSGVIGHAGPPGPRGPAGAAGDSGLTVAYADLIDLSEPVVGWDMQDAAGGTTFSATHGAAALGNFTNITKGEAANPLYPGAVSGKTSGGAGAGCVSTGAIGGLTGKHGGYAMEAWIYLPANINVNGLAVAYAKADTPFEGYGVGFGDANYGAALASDVIVSAWKAGVNNYGGSSGVGSFVSATQLARECALSGPLGWHHFAVSLEKRSDSYPIIYMDGLPIGPLDASTDTNHAAFTSAARASVFNDPAKSATISANLQACHVYIYDRPLEAAEAQARVALVKYLNAQA